jgi:HSP20 family protein
MNLYGDEEALILTIDLPGVPPETVEVKVEDGLLTVTGVRPRSLLHRGLDIYLQEAPRGLFTRSLRLPVKVDAESVIVTTADGLLTVIMPLAAASSAADGGAEARAARERWGW